MEPRFGHDFGNVRVHSDAKAAASAKAVNASAYTVGRDVVLGERRYAPGTVAGKRLLAHELAHVVQHGRQTQVSHTGLEVGGLGEPAERQAASVAERVVAGGSAPGIDPQAGGVLRRQEFKPWPGQTGTDVAGTRQQAGDVVSERVQRTGDPNYSPPQPILLAFDQKACNELVSTMEINFVHPADRSARLSVKKFDQLKTRILSVANERLNGWVKIQVGDAQSCSVCRGRTLSVRVVARGGSSADASTVELRRGTGRASAGQIFEGGEDWLTSLLGGVSEGTLWHESGHIVLGAPDEYPAEPGDPARPADKINTGDWSAMSTHHSFGRRAVMHPRHFSFMTAWLGRRFPDCKFDLVAQPIPLTIDVVAGLGAGAASLGGWGFYESADLALGVPLDKQRRFRLLAGGYASFVANLGSSRRTAFLAGALVGLDYSTNRSSGGLALGADLRLGGATLDVSSTDPERNRWVPTAGGNVSLGYAGPKFELGVTGGVGAALTGPYRGDPYFLLGLRAGLNF